MKIGVFYGSTTGNTETVAKKVAAELDPLVTTIRDVADAEVEEFQAVDVLLLGGSTWDVGELQEDWARMLPMLEGVDLSGKVVAFFGLGDACSYSWNYLDCLGEIHETIEESGATFIGKWPTDEYEFDESRAQVEEGFFLGVGLDEDNDPELTDIRLYAWLSQVWGELESMDLAPAEETIKKLGA